MSSRLASPWKEITRRAGESSREGIRGSVWASGSRTRQRASSTVRGLLSTSRYSVREAKGETTKGLQPPGGASPARPAENCAASTSAPLSRGSSATIAVEASSTSGGALTQPASATPQTSTAASRRIFSGRAIFRVWEEVYYRNGGTANLGDQLETGEFHERQQRSRLEKVPEASHHDEAGGRARANQVQGRSHRRHEGRDPARGNPCRPRGGARHLLHPAQGREDGAARPHEP